MGIYALKLLCDIATMLKDEIGEEEVPEWSDLAYYDKESRPTDCTKGGSKQYQFTFSPS